MVGYLVVPFIILLAVARADAEGFVTKDLTSIEQVVRDALGPGCIARAEPKQLIGSCRGEVGQPIVSIQFSRQADGTEERVRSGVTGMADLERLCRARSAACTLSALDVAPAVGWITAYPLGRSAGTTVVIVRDGAMLTLRSVASDPVAAHVIVARLLPIIRAGVVGF